MKKFLEDILYALKLSLYYFGGSFILGLIIGLVLHGFNFTEVVLWGCRVSQILSILGFSISGISFVKKDLMRPLNYQKQWETYFYKLNLSHVIFLISFFIMVFSFTIDYFVRPIASL